MPGCPILGTAAYFLGVLPELSKCIYYFLASWTFKVHGDPQDPQALTNQALQSIIESLIQILKVCKPVCTNVKLRSEIHGWWCSKNTRSGERRYDEWWINTSEVIFNIVHCWTRSNNMVYVVRCLDQYNMYDISVSSKNPISHWEWCCTHL